MSVIESTTYDAPGEAGSPVTLRERYDNFIGGEWVAPTTGDYRENLTPSTGEPFCEVAHSGAAGHRARARRRARGQGRLGTAIADRARGRAQRRRRRDRREPRDARRRRELRERQAGARDARRRHSARGRPLPLLRRRDPLRGGADLGDRRADLRLPLPRAARRRRSDHPVQLPAADGGVEDRARAGGRQLHGDQAGQPDAVVDPEADGGDRRHRPAGRAQRRERSGRGDRQGAGVEQADRQDRVHRRDGDRPADHVLRRRRT